MERDTGETRVRIGVISDTHGFLDPRVAELFAGVAHILHAGDIGREGVVRELEGVAPVTAVVGNVDGGGMCYPETQRVDLGGRRFVVRHVVDVLRPTPGWRAFLAEAGVEVVVFGHTHRRYCEWIEGRLYVNPGSAGRSGPAEGRSVAVIEMEGGGIDVRFFDLVDGGGRSRQAGGGSGW